MLKHPGYAALGFDGVNANRDQGLDLLLGPLVQLVRAHAPFLAMSRAAALTKANASGPL